MPFFVLDNFNGGKQTKVHLVCEEIISVFFLIWCGTFNTC